MGPIQCEVVITPFAEKQLKKLPLHIKEHVRYWAISIENLGISEIRKLPGYHDEPLKGSRKGQRSIRLSKAYRLIYELDEQHLLNVISVVEINKHDY